MSNRSQINNALVELLKQIDGSVSPYDSTYIFATNLHNNVYKGLKYYDEINDFPSLYITSPSEYRTYNTAEFTEATVASVIRAYVKGDNTNELTNNIVNDIEHIIYNMKLSVELSVQDITITEIKTDSGLLKPYGIAEIFLSTRFEIFNF
jgi:hypothetical protein